MINQSPTIWSNLSSADYARRPSMDAGMDRRRRVTWIISFTDLMAIMLSFFVLLFAMSSPEPTSFQAMSNAVQGESQGEEISADQNAGREIVDTAGMNTVAIDQQALNMDYIESVLNEYIKQLPESAQNAITITRSEARLIINGGALLAFEEGVHSLSQDGEHLIAGVAPILNAFDTSIMLVGYAKDEVRDDAHDLSPYSQEVMLAIKRSHGVTSVVLEKGYQGQILTAAASGSSAFVFQQENTQNSRPSFPRRVDIVILNTVQ